jgi:chromosome segregation ATPase
MTTATDELGQYEQRVGEAQRRVQALGRDLAELAAKVDALKEERVLAYSVEDERRASQLSKKIADLQVKQEEVGERRRGAEVAAQRVTGEHQAFVAERYPDLIAEIAPQAREAAKRIDQLSDQLLTGLKAAEDIRGRVSDLARIAGRTGQHAPSLGWDQLARLLRDRPRPTPIPMPEGWFAPATVVPHDHPDEAIRQNAREKVREQSGKGA